MLPRPPPPHLPPLHYRRKGCRMKHSHPRIARAWCQKLLSVQNKNLNISLPAHTQSACQHMLNRLASMSAITHTQYNLASTHAIALPTHTQSLCQHTRNRFASKHKLARGYVHTSTNRRISMRLTADAFVVSSHLPLRLQSLHMQRERGVGVGRQGQQVACVQELFSIIGTRNNS